MAADDYGTRGGAMRKDKGMLNTLTATTPVSWL